MNKTKRNRLKNKEKIKKLQLQVNKLISTPIVKEVIIKDTTAVEKCVILQKEIYGLHRFISRANLSVDVLTYSFNCDSTILVPQLSDGALTAQALDKIRFNKYELQGNRPEPLYCIGLSPSGGIGKELQVSFHLSRDLIRDFPVDVIIHKHLAKLLEARKHDLLR